MEKLNEKASNIANHNNLLRESNNKIVLNQEFNKGMTSKDSEFNDNDNENEYDGRKI